MHHKIELKKIYIEHTGNPIRILIKKNEFYKSHKIKNSHFKTKSIIDRERDRKKIITHFMDFFKLVITNLYTN